MPGIFGKIGAMFGKKKKVADMTLTEIEAEIEQNKNKDRTKVDRDRQTKLGNRKIELLSKPHTGFQTLKAW